MNLGLQLTRILSMDLPRPFFVLTLECDWSICKEFLGDLWSEQLLCGKGPIADNLLQSEAEADPGIFDRRGPNDNYIEDIGNIYSNAFQGYR